MILVISTRNKKKLKEIKRLLKGLPIDVLDLTQAEEKIGKKIPAVKEDKKTFAANAVKKALAPSRLIKDALVLADDSGLVVRSLSGAPGLNSARYAGPAQNDDRNIARLLKNMEAAGGERDAYFCCTIAIARNGKTFDICEGKVSGAITKERRGKSGFGYDPVFLPAGYKKTFAQMNPAYKNKISHRAKALKKAGAVIQTYLRRHP